jgi:cytochrome c oxidase subunit 3
MSQNWSDREFFAPPRTRVDNNLLAVGFFVAVEAILFLIFIASFVYLRARGAPFPPPGVPRLDPTFPIINLIILLASGLVAYRGLISIRRYRITWAERRLLAASALGVIFLIGQVREYAVLFQNGVTASSSLYGALFYLTIGFHGLHVLSGVVWLLVVWYATRQAHETPFKHFGVQAAVLYWSFVTLIWIVLFLLLYVV